VRILFLCRFLPHPKVRTSGGQDIFHCISSLSKRHQVSVIAFVSPGEEENVIALRSTCETVVAVPYYPSSLLPRVWRLAWRILMPQVYGRVFSLAYRRQLRELQTRHRFDIAVVEGTMAQYGAMIRGVPRVLDEVDIYSVVAYHAYQNAKGILQRGLTLMDWLRQQAVELHYAGGFEGVLVRSAKDQEILRGFLPDQRVNVLSPWFEGLDELQTVTPSRPRGNKLLFVGAMNLPANIEAARYFCNYVLPLIRQQVPDAELFVVGSSPVEEIQTLGDRPGITVTGEVEQLLPYYEQSAVNVVPLLTGGGVIVKTLNGLAAARPTVATPIGNSGTGAQPNRELLVVDRAPERFAEQVVRLLNDYDLWTRLAVNGRRFVVEKYNWERTIQRMEAFLFSLLEQIQSANTTKEVLKHTR
jgi:glycosyltransferase involved in cell wall biosynthesis